MASKIKDFFNSWWFFGLIVVIQATILWFAPNEKTIGNGIKPVYLHVSMTWAGMIFFFLAGLLGIFTAALGKQRLAIWFRSLYFAAFVLYLSGFLVSMYASWLNWGGIPFQEPRIRNAINVVVVGIAIFTFMELVRNIRLQGVAGVVPILFIVFSRGSDRMVLHPDNPVTTAPAEIKATFGIMFVVALFLTIWVVGQARKLYSEKIENPGATTPLGEMNEL